MVRFPSAGAGPTGNGCGAGQRRRSLNAANEVAVAQFIDRNLGFTGIPALVEATLDAMERRGEMAEPQCVEEALAVDHNARRLALDLLPEIAAMAS